MKKSQEKQIFNICFAGMTAAVYVALTLLSSVFGLSSGAIQIRLSEALCVLPLYSSAAIPGLAIGCLIANIMSGVWQDMVFGTLATLIGALGTYRLGKNLRKSSKLCLWLWFLPPVLSNSLIIPFVIYFAYANSNTFSLALLFPMIAAGEILSAGVIGSALIPVFDRIFKTRKKG